MGYHTSYALSVLDASTGEQALDDVVLIGKLRDSIDEAAFAIDESGDAYNATKWYSHEEDLVRFSLEHPARLFVLNGEGEEARDIWRLYVLNGKCCREKAQIVIAPFDTCNLK